MPDRLFFDALTQVGPRNRKHSAQPWKIEDVLAEMAHCSISGALISYTTQVLYDLHHENLRLCSMLQPHDQLFPVWNVMPHQTGEFPAPDVLDTLLQEHGVRAVSIHPNTNAWDWEADHSRELFSWLAEQRVLTRIAANEFDKYRHLDHFLERYPDLPLLLTGSHWAQQRYLLPLLQKHRNLHITFDQLQIHYGIEYLCSVGCEDQLLFGSNAPGMSMGAHRSYIDYADVSEQTKDKIAGGNLIRLLKGQRPPRLTINGDEDEIMAAARQGQPVPVPVIDMHMHILDEGLNGAGGAYRMDKGGPSGVFPLLDRLGCQGGGFMSWNGTVCPDSAAGNQTVARVLEEAPAGYWGLGTFDTNHYSQSELKQMIPALYESDPRFIGMKPYVLYGVEYHHPSYDVWWEYGNTHHLYALMHRVRGDFLEIDTLAEKYPNVRWVVAHCGANYATADGIIECMKKHPNVYAEITLTPVTFGIIDYLAEHAGADRIVYGSDLPMRDPRQQFGWVVFSRLSVAEKRQVLHENACRIIAPCLDRLPAHCRPPASTKDPSQ